MLQFRLRRRLRVSPRAIAISVSAVGVVALTVLSPRTRAQTAAVTPNPGSGHLVLHSRELPPPVGDPFESRPNYLRTAIALRHWRQPEISFHVTPDPKDKRTPEAERALVAQGLAVWKDKIAGPHAKLSLTMTDSADSADVEIGFVPTGSLRGNQIGETDISFTVPENDIQRATIQLVEGLSADQLVQAVAHESGHVLGIQGHSDDRSDLMYPTSHLPTEISERDQNTINVAYYQIDTNKRRALKRGQKLGSVKSY